jgi:DNA-binding MarR family transcriptional regulator
MATDVLNERTVALDAFVRLLRSHAVVTRRFSAELQAEHGLTINDYEVLLYLSRAPERRMRRVDLAGSVLLTPSGITRLLDGLERQGFVSRADCDSDRRVSYAQLTASGTAKLREASKSHIRGVDGLFSAHYTEDELRELASLLERLGAAGDASECSPG